MEQSEALLDRGLHPMRIADGFERACSVAVDHLDGISDTIEYTKDSSQNLLKAAMTSLGSKMYVYRVLMHPPDTYAFFHFSVSRRHTKSLPR